MRLGRRAREGRGRCAAPAVRSSTRIDERTRASRCTSPSRRSWSSGLPHVDVRLGDATALPLPDVSIDVLISNGVFNLVPDKARALAEMLRVLRPGGRLQIADIALGSELDAAAQRDVELWTG